MKITTQEQMERTLQAIELLTGYNLANISKARERFMSQGPETPDTIHLPVAEFKLLGMTVKFKPGGPAIVEGPTRTLYVSEDEKT